MRRIGDVSVFVNMVIAPPGMDGARFRRKVKEGAEGMDKENGGRLEASSNGGLRVDAGVDRIEKDDACGVEKSTV